MNLVNELQISAERDDVLTVLRKTKRLVSKLGRDDISDWLRSELEGYGDKKSIPDYRKVSTTISMNTNGYIPAGYGMIARGVQDVPQFSSFAPTEFPIAEPISSVLSWIENLVGKGHGVYFPVNHKGEHDSFLRSHVHPMFADQVSFLLKMNEYQIKAIPEQIKDKVLDWACALEAAGVHGENMTFDDREKQLANAIKMNLVFNQTNNNARDVNNQIQAS